MNDDSWDIQSNKDLLKALLLLDSEEEAKSFLRDLLTEKEVYELGHRWEAARMLHAGVPYTTIEKKTGLSSTTIARISKWLNAGEGGYGAMLTKWGKL